MLSVPCSSCFWLGLILRQYKPKAGRIRSRGVPVSRDANQKTYISYGESLGTFVKADKKKLTEPGQDSSARGGITAVLSMDACTKDGLESKEIERMSCSCRTSPNLGQKI
jgi:hypothetical protein